MLSAVAALYDVHGNLPALEAVQPDLAQFSVDQVVVEEPPPAEQRPSDLALRREMDEGIVPMKGYVYSSE